MSDGIAEIKIENDVAGELKIRPAAMQTMEHIADRGGEIRWSWENIKPETREMVADMIIDGYVIEREHVTSALQVHGALTLRLTDKGRNVVDKHRKRKLVASTVRSIETSGEIG